MRRKLQIFIILILSLFWLMLQRPACWGAPPTNYNSGISVLFGGTQGVDWDEEVFWHNPVEDDHKVVYIKDSTLISMEHNERNMRQTFDSSYYVYDIGDEGLIRFIVDRDLQLKYFWSRIAGDSTVERYPAYPGPFRFSELEYEPGVPVVGTVGGRGSDPHDRQNYYYTGTLDEFGDEWHTIAFADDDEWLIDTFSDFNPDSHSHHEKLASDGKTILFVVNPKTPLIKFEKVTSDAQFYTTPPKAYWIPKVHAQITYITDNVEIQLVNIMGGDINYKINNGPTQTYTGPIRSNELNNGENIIEYWYREEHHKIRTIIKNPDFPSGGESHGYLLWKDDSELKAIKARLQTGEDHGYKNFYDIIKRDNFFNHHHIPLGEGKRVGSTVALTNAFIALVEGYTYTRAGDSDSYATYAKRMLLDTVRNLDPLWFGDPTGTPNPCSQINYRGYYDVNVIFSNAFAYDILIKDYKSTQYPGGITPIEDYKIRDMLARFALETMMELGNYGNYMSRHNAQGMWGTARALGSLIVAVTMPSYDTHYYGTSGFDRKTATHPYTPYPDRPVTWKEAFLTEKNPLYDYPNQAHRYLDQHIYLPSGATYDSVITERSHERNDGMVVQPGNWANRIGYYSVHLMGHCFYIVANVMKIKENHTYPYWEMAFDNANKGTLYGLQIGTPEDANPQKFPQLILINERFPNIAPDAEANLHKDYTHPDNNFTLWRQMTRNGVYSLILYHDNWEDFLPEDQDQPDEEWTEQYKTGLECYNNVFDPTKGERAFIRVELANQAHVKLSVYNTRGNRIKELADEKRDAGTYPYHWDGKNDSGNVVGSGLYFVHMEVGDYKKTKKIVVVK